MADLNPEQSEAVGVLRGPLLVLAGAGSGKTRVVTFRIANLIRSGVTASRILAVTFTNKAAAEMQERIRALLGRRLKDRPQISTFHSHCVRILRRHIVRLGYPEKFAISDHNDQLSLAHKILREIHVSAATLRPADLLHWIGRWKTRGIRPPAAATQAASDIEHLAASAYRRYQRALKAAGAVDFDDLLLLAEELLVGHPDVLADEASRFDHVLIDEYQDTNATQYQIIHQLCARHRNLCVVGDDDQSIYGWRGAEVEHILRFRDDWPDARVVRLERNYRSTEAILTLANRLIAFNKVRHDKILRAARPGGEQPRIEQLPTETAEAEFVAKDIALRLTEPGIEPRDFAILFRTNEQPRAFEIALAKAKVPYVLIGGRSFYDRREIRDLLSYLRVLDEPSDETALRRILNTPPRGLGPKAVEALTTEAVRRGCPLWDVLREPGEAIKPAVAESSLAFVSLVAPFAERARKVAQGLGGADSLVDVARSLLHAVNYRSEIERQFTEPEDREARWNSVEELVNSVGAYEQEADLASLTGFLDDAALGQVDRDRDKSKELKANGVALLTLHSAKGLEFPYVYMVGLEEGILPHRRSIELEEQGAVDEERRLCYVGVTRAQERLTLCQPQTRLKWGKARETIPSRFLWELIGRADNPQALATRRRPAAGSPAARSGRHGASS